MNSYRYVWWSSLSTRSHIKLLPQLLGSLPLIILPAVCAYVFMHETRMPSWGGMEADRTHKFFCPLWLHDHARLVTIML